MRAARGPEPDPPGVDGAMSMLSEVARIIPESQRSRGERYFAQGRDTLVAGEGQLLCDCNCPFADDTLEMCKHVTHPDKGIGRAVEESAQTPGEFSGPKSGSTIPAASLP